MADTSYDCIVVEQIGDVAIIRLNDEKTLNAASLRMTEELLDAFAQAGKTARAILLTGDGRGFCSGANLSGDLDPFEPGYDAGAVLLTHYNPLMLAIKNLPVPFVTAVNGAAAGIGCAIALAGDIIVASDRAYFLQAFRRIGLVPDGGSAFLLTRGAGRARAMEMMLLGEKLPAATALAWGLVNRVVPHDTLLASALELAQELAAGPTSVLRMIRKMCWDSFDSGFEDQIAVERDLQCIAGRAADHREGVAAFLQKRPAAFSGQ